MTMRLPDPRVWLPIVAALTMLATREVRRQPPPLPPEAGRAVTIPLPRATAAPRRELAYELQPAATTVRFHDERDGRSRFFECHVVAGHLLLSPTPGASRIDLRLDLESLRPLREPGADGPAAAQTLGLEKHAELTYHARLVSTSTTPIPCLVHTLWQGTLRFGGRAVRQDIGLWQTAFPGHPLRLQGHGTVAGDTFGLPRRGLFGFLNAKHAITLGLDLAWQRSSDR